MEPQDKRQQWLDEAAAMRARPAAPGVADRATLRSSGALPPAPIAHLMGILPMSVEPGRTVFQGTPERAHYNPSGVVHGGYAATMLDTALGCALHTMLPAGKGYTTLELKVNYIRAMTDTTGPVRAEATVVSVGGQVGVAEARITDANGKLYAFATTTCLVFEISAG
ncbi:PaaI family thioesterase [Massilia scottii]|uniref:PaaI family thioesterase n=1 Tax=Massilia scottii TaxID=3057166 RepID=UPI00279668D6|nr:PaaI family thioesterase [Massilia sp. CCM 9029]MDQ1831147.1 PaaI family thioesterase [Massilia sp. CCM 9029]